MTTISTNDPMQVLTYASLSNAAYSRGVAPLGWSIVSIRVNPDNGFAATVFQNETTGKIVIGYRGTDGITDATSSWGQLALQNDVPVQYNDAYKLYKDIERDYPGVNITITGHSLGGALAQLVAAFTGAPAYTYNAPGVEAIYRGMPGSNPDATSGSFNISNSNMAFDGVSTRGAQLGNITNYEPSSLEGLAIFAGIVATAVNPSIGVLVFGGTVLGQHYIDRLEEAIATPKPTETLNGYVYDRDTTGWSMPSTDGSPPLPADDTTSASLSAQREANLQYNGLVTQTRTWLTEYRNWQTVTEQLTARYGQVWTDFDPQYDSIGWIRDTKGNFVAQFQMLEENGQAVMKILGDGGQTVNLTEGTISGIGTLFHSLASGVQTLTNAIGQYGGTLIDALSIIKAIQSGNPLPIAVSGLRLANDISNLADLPNYNLSGAASVGGSILSVMSLEQALQHGDTLAALTAGAQALSFGAQAYASFAFDQALSGNTAFIDSAWESQAFAGSIGEALPYLSIVNSLAHGDAMGAAIAAISISFPPIGIAYAVFSMITSLFGDEDPPPEPWGNAWAGWSGFSAVANSNGGDGGQGTAAETYNGFISYLNQLAAYEQSVNPGSAIGIVANRLPSLSYRNYTGFGITDIDAITGVQRDPSIRYDLTGRPYNAPAGSEQASQSLSERFIRVALARGAIAPMWEVQTAAIQTQYGDPQAGLTEEERAGRNGKLAAPVTGDTQTFRAVALDLNGDGVQTTGTNKTVAFDVDDSGFMKNTAWLDNSDGFLFLDRNLNGQIDSGKELFSNSIVDLSARGLAGMRWIDSNYDGKLTNADPVWNELKVWRDADGDGLADAGETQTLSALGITALDYAMGRFEQNGQLKEMSSPDLAADTAGTRTHVVPEGIVVETTSGHTSLLVTRIDDRTVIEANRDGITSYEDIEAIVSTADLMANDTLVGISGHNLMPQKNCLRKVAQNDSAWRIAA